MKLIKDVVISNDFFENRNGEPLVICNKNLDAFYDCHYKTPHTNVGFRIAYFLWIMRGSNSLDALNYYSKHVDKMSDNNINLRGAYGPRLKYWIGADQLQEAIKINSDIDDEEDMEKPNGVNQLEMVYNDLIGGVKTSACQVFDPSVDFEDSKDIPDLSSMIFCWDKELTLNAMFTNTTLNGHFINDYFFLSLLNCCMAAILKTPVGSLNVFTTNANSILDKDVKKGTIKSRPRVIPENNNPESLWKDIFALCEFEKHLRNSVTKDSINMLTVDVLPWCETILRKTVDATETSCQFWKDCAYTLFAFVLIKEDKKRFEDYILEYILPKVVGRFQDEILMELGNG